MVVDTGSDDTGQDNEAGEDSGRTRARSGAGGRDLPDPRKLAQDWITLWQSELSAMAADPELQEAWQTIMALWAGGMSAMLRTLPRTERHEHRSAGPAWAADAPRAAPAAAAPDPRDAEIDRLARHVAALERRLAELERGGDPGVHPKGGARGGKRRG